MSEPTQCLDFGEVLADWRERGMQHINPVRFSFIEALAQRASSHQGDARRLIEEKLTRLITEYADGLATAAPSQQENCLPSSPHSALAALLDHVAAQRSSPELQTLAHLRTTWVKLSAQKRLKHALASAPRKAGPLNSQQLVHRCLLLMQDISPVYLQHLISTIDTLSWAAQPHGSGTLVDSTCASRGTAVKAKRDDASPHPRPPRLA